jgi:hypothetical protein
MPSVPISADFGNYFLDRINRISMIWVSSRLAGSGQSCQDFRPYKICEGRNAGEGAAGLSIGVPEICGKPSEGFEQKETKVTKAEFCRNFVILVIFCKSGSGSGSARVPRVVFGGSPKIFLTRKKFVHRFPPPDSAD